jgi:hypothetical protein
MAFFHRFRWVIFGVAAVALVAAATYSVSTGSSPKSKVAGVLGPTSGPNSSGHITDKRAYLKRAAASDPSASSGALISLSKMVRPAEAQAFATSGKLTAVFVRFPASDPEAIKITGSITDAMNARAKEVQDVVRGEISGLDKEAASATGARKKQVQDLIAGRQRGLDALKGDCACIYAVVLEDSTLAKLEALQGRPEVRLVDVPDPPVASLEGWQLTPILPGARTG